MRIGHGTTTWAVRDEKIFTMWIVSSQATNTGRAEHVMLDETRGRRFSVKLPSLDSLDRMGIVVGLTTLCI